MIYNLSARLKQLRQEKHLKQEQVALLVGVTKSAVSSWELDMRNRPMRLLSVWLTFTVSAPIICLAEKTSVRLTFLD